MGPFAFAVVLVVALSILQPLALLSKAKAKV
jgi:hypothetical protein